MSETIRRTITGLAPGTDFLVRVRAYSRLGIASEYSEVLMVKTGGDETVPNAPTGLVADFTTSDLILQWTAPTKNTDGTDLNDLGRYKITLTSGAVTKQFESYVPMFYLPITQNRVNFSPGGSNFTISIVALDVYDKPSAALTGTATQPDLLKPLTPVLFESGTNVRVNMRPQSIDVPKISNYIVEHSLDGVTWSEVANTTSDTFTHSVTPLTTNHYRYKFQDVFGRFSPVSDPASITTSQVGSDGVPPASSPDAIVSNSIGMLYVRWEPINNPDPVTYEMHLSPTIDFTGYPTTTKVGETDSTFGFIKTLPGTSTPLTYNTNYYVRILAKDADGYAPTHGAHGVGQARSVATEDIAEEAVKMIHFAEGSISDPTKFSAGVITGHLIKANTITTHNMVIGSFDNLIMDPAFNMANLAASPHWVVGNGAGVGWDYFSTVDARSGTKVLRYNGGGTQTAVATLNLNGDPTKIGQQVAASPGDTHSLTAYARSATVDPANRFRCIIYYCGETGTVLATHVSDYVALTTTYQRAAVTVPSTAPAPGGTAFVRFVLESANNANGTYYNNPTLFDDTYARKTIEGRLLVDGTITGRKIEAGSILASDAVFGNAAIVNANIDSLNASKLTAGTIDANVISVINLNASNIKAGTISGINVTGGTVTAGVSGGKRIVLNNSTGVIDLYGANNVKYGAFQVVLNSDNTTYSMRMESEYPMSFVKVSNANVAQSLYVDTLRIGGVNGEATFMPEAANIIALRNPNISGTPYRSLKVAQLVRSDGTNVSWSDHAAHHSHTSSYSIDVNYLYVHSGFVNLYGTSNTGIYAGDSTGASVSIPTGGTGGPEIQSRPHNSTTAFRGFAGSFFRQVSSAEYKMDIEDVTEDPLEAVHAFASATKKFKMKPTTALLVNGNGEEEEVTQADSHEYIGPIIEGVPEEFRVGDGYILNDLVARLTMVVASIDERLKVLEASSKDKK